MGSFCFLNITEILSPCALRLTMKNGEKKSHVGNDSNGTQLEAFYRRIKKGTVCLCVLLIDVF